MERDFAAERRSYIRQLAADEALATEGMQFVERSSHHRYSYNFDWLGLPIIQYPADIVALQELIWSIKPSAVVETGVARGGSLALSASILHLLGGHRIVVGVDIDIREPNRQALDRHPLADHIKLIEGSSTDDSTFAKVCETLAGRSPVLVVLDSMHTHGHVLRELEIYSQLVTPGSYVVVFDTSIESVPADYFPDRPWGPGNSPMSAVREFLSQPGCRFLDDQDYNAKLVISTAVGGYLRCVTP